VTCHRFRVSQLGFSRHKSAAGSAHPKKKSRAE
jgi:hypothetical protein